MKYVILLHVHDILSRNIWP